MSPSPSVLTCAIGPPVGSNSAYSRSSDSTMSRMRLRVWPIDTPRGGLGTLIAPRNLPTDEEWASRSSHRSAIHTEPSEATANDDGWLFTDSWKNLNPSSEDRRPNGTKKSFCHLAGLSESSALRTSG